MGFQINGKIYLARFVFDYGNRMNLCSFLCLMNLFCFKLGILRGLNWVQFECFIKFPLN